MLHLINKRYSLLLTVIIFSSLLSGFIIPGKVFIIKSPKIVFKKDSHNFGKVESGIVLNYAFKFTNKGSETLKIGNITTSCGCTGATIGDKTKYEKYESGEINVTFNTQGRSGLQEKVIIVHSNDPKNPHKVLKVKCNIIE